MAYRVNAAAGMPAHGCRHLPRSFCPSTHFFLRSQKRAVLSPLSAHSSRCQISLRVTSLMHMKIAHDRAMIYTFRTDRASLGSERVINTDILNGSYNTHSLFASSTRRFSSIIIQRSKNGTAAHWRSPAPLLLCCDAPCVPSLEKSGQRPAAATTASSEEPPGTARLPRKLDSKGKSPMPWSKTVHQRTCAAPSPAVTCTSDMSSLDKAAQSSVAATSASTEKLVVTACFPSKLGSTRRLTTWSMMFHQRIHTAHSPTPADVPPLEKPAQLLADASASVEEQPAGKAAFRNHQLKSTSPCTPAPAISRRSSMRSFEDASAITSASVAKKLATSIPPQTLAPDDRRPVSSATVPPPIHGVPSSAHVRAAASSDDPPWIKAASLTEAPTLTKAAKTSVSGTTASAKGKLSTVPVRQGPVVEDRGTTPWSMTVPQPLLKASRITTAPVGSRTSEVSSLTIDVQEQLAGSSAARKGVLVTPSSTEDRGRTPWSMTFPQPLVLLVTTAPIASRISNASLLTNNMQVAVSSGFPKGLLLNASSTKDRGLTPWSITVPQPILKRSSVTPPVASRISDISSLTEDVQKQVAGSSASPKGLLVTANSTKEPANKEGRLTPAPSATLAAGPRHVTGRFDLSWTESTMGTSAESAETSKKSTAGGLPAITTTTRTKIKPTSSRRTQDTDFLKPLKNVPRENFGENLPMVFTGTASTQKTDGMPYLSYMDDKRNYTVYYAAGVEAANWIVKKIRGTLVGLDIEWEVPLSEHAPAVSLVQLCDTDRTIVLLHVHHMSLPSELVRIINNSAVLKVGNNIKADLTRLRKQCPQWSGSGLVTGDNIADLLSLAKSFGLKTGEKSLQNMCRVFLNNDLYKPSKMFHSYWGKKELPQPHLQYAANDAYASLVVYESMMKRQNNVNATRPAEAAATAGATAIPST